MVICIITAIRLKGRRRENFQNARSVPLNNALAPEANSLGEKALSVTLLEQATAWQVKKNSSVTKIQFHLSPSENQKSRR